MRDPNRLGIMLSLFAQIWHKNTDMRFGQLVLSIQDKMKAMGLTSTKAGIFYPEDYHWEKAMRDILQNGF